MVQSFQYSDFIFPYICCVRVLREERYEFNFICGFYKSRKAGTLVAFAEGFDLNLVTSIDLYLKSATTRPGKNA